MDYVMVVNVLFLHTMILGYDQTHMIDDWVWVLVEDQDRWNSFPWGAYAFSLLEHYMSLVPSTEVELKRKFKKTEEKQRLSYHFYGPVWALLQLCFIYLEPSEHEVAMSYYRSVLLRDCMGVTYEAQRNKRIKTTYQELARAHQQRALSPPQELSLLPELPLSLGDLRVSFLSRIHCLNSILDAHMAFQKSSLAKGAFYAQLFMIISSPHSEAQGTSSTFILYLGSRMGISERDEADQIMPCPHCSYRLDNRPEWAFARNSGFCWKLEAWQLRDR
ncbi:hypothetical protein C2S51_001523 [Perilla frutescens var. frutescens]|nr:hypothetical protein C2S51_001523 [Perilla frutescens var. frutescens]